MTYSKKSPQKSPFLLTCRVIKHTLMTNKKPSSNFTLFEQVDEAQIKREKAKARELRESQWWRQQIGEGRCYYCENKFSKEFLTMDHVIPIARGGKSTKSNVVVCCKECNSKKKYHTPVEMTLQAMGSKND
jgi:5-methylcytosine-specific restriction protein A